VWESSLEDIFNFIPDVKQNYDHWDEYCYSYLDDYTDGDLSADTPI